jgi:hypothetical protein
MSTEVTSLQFREMSSKEMLPVPEKRSRAFLFSRSNLLSRILNSPVFAKSVVGLTGKLPGGFNTLPLYLPLMIRKLFV